MSVAAVPPQTRTRRPETRLLEAAKEQIARKGLEGLDIRRLAQKAKTSTSQFHEYYQKRENLLAAVFDAGWQSIERHVSKLLFAKTPTSVEELVELILNGVFDAFADDRNGVSATIIIGLATIGQPMGPRIRATSSYSRFSDLIRNLHAQILNRMPPEEARDCLEVLFAAVSRKLLMLTPLHSGSGSKAFDRDVFLRVMRRTVRGLLSTNIQDANTPQPV